MAGSIAVLAGALVLYGAAPALWVAAIGVAGCGFGYGSSFTTFAGLSQQAASEDMRGRALAVNTFILGALYPLGALVQGWLSDRVGLKWVTVGSGVALAICLAWRLMVIARSRSSVADARAARVVGVPHDVVRSREPPSVGRSLRRRQPGSVSERPSIGIGCFGVSRPTLPKGAERAVATTAELLREGTSARAGVVRCLRAEELWTVGVAFGRGQGLRLGAAACRTALTSPHESSALSR